MDDADFEQVLENADSLARKVYREEAKAIEEIRKGIVEVSAKEEPYDIFICYKETDEKGERTVDSVLAQDVYDALTDKGYRVFFARISLEDKLGQEYEPYIFAALNSAKVMLAFGTDYEYFNAVWVKNEWARFLELMAKDKTRHLIPCYKDIDAYDMPKEFKALQAQDLGKVGAVQDLLRGIEKLLPKKQVEKETVVVQQSATNTTELLLKRALIAVEDGEWKKVEEVCEQVLSIDPECAMAYLYMLMADYRVRDRETLSFLDRPISLHKYYQRIMKLADGALQNELQGYVDTVRNRKLKSIYEEAISEMKLAKNAKDFLSVAKKFKDIQDFQDSKDLYAECISKAEAWEEKNSKHLHAMREKIMSLQNFISAGFSAGRAHTVGLKSDGTVVAVGNNKFGQCNISNWYDIVAVVAGSDLTLGLKSDGTVLAVGNNYSGQCNISEWKNIAAIATGNSHTVGLKSDGTVLAVGRNDEGQCNVMSWKNIVAISAGSHTVGLKSDGTVLAVGRNDEGQCNVMSWKNIVAITTGYDHTVGLKSDGTVVAVGNNKYNQCDVANWTDIVAVSARGDYTVALKADGSVVAVGENFKGRCNLFDRKNIVSVSAGFSHTVGLKKDGTVVATEYTGDRQYYCGECEVSDWKLFFSFENLQQEKQKAMSMEKEKASRRAQGLCQYCGGQLKGLFSKKCVNCGKPKDYS